MPKLPAYRLHRASGQAVVTLTDAVTRRRIDIYLGEHGTAESRAAYDRTLSDWLAGGRVVERAARLAQSEAAPPPSQAVTVTVVVRRFWTDTQTRYSKTRRLNIYTALKFARSLFGKLPADKFGPKALRKVRTAMIAKGWTRSVVNDRARTIQRAFQWAASHELVKPSVWQALASVPPLRRGEDGVKADGSMEAVALAHVEAARPFMSAPVRALVDLQLLTGARGGELLQMRAVDIDTTGKVWIYRPATHKNEHRGHDRLIYIGPKAQDIIKPFLQARDRLDGYLFSPRDGNADRKAATATKGKPRRENQQANATKTTRRMRDCYDSCSYRRAITRACEAANAEAVARGDKAGVPDWSPHQLRHTAATEIRREFGLEAASLVLGHSSATVTDAVYAERDGGKVADVMLRIG